MPWNWKKSTAANWSSPSGARRESTLSSIFVQPTSCQALPFHSRTILGLALPGSKGPVNSMFERLEQIELKYEELNKALASPEIVSDSARYQKTAKAHSELAPIVEKYREYKDLTRGIEE